ncbi:hypothetical protein ACU4GD_27915 [Cupriavidus basilensis]
MEGDPRGMMAAMRWMVCTDSRGRVIGGTPLLIEPRQPRRHGPRAVLGDRAAIPELDDDVVAGLRLEAGLNQDELAALDPWTMLSPGHAGRKPTVTVGTMIQPSLRLADSH